MEFENLTEDQNINACNTGMVIYEYLQTINLEKTTESLNLQLNALCMALTCFIHENVPIDNRSVAIQIIHKILTKNC